MSRDDDEGEGERGRLRGRRRRRLPSGADVAGAKARARAAWRDLHDRSMVRRGGGQLLVMDGPEATAGICSLRPLTQVFVAALALERLDRLDPSAPTAPSVADLADTLELYRWGDGYAEFPGTDAVSGPDNARVALAALQAHAQLDPPVADSLWLHRAKRTFDAVTTGPLRVELAARLHLVTGIERFASIAIGLDGDEVAGDDEAMIGVELLRGEVTRDPDRVARAVARAARVLDLLGADDRWWRRPPADNAALFGDLLLLHAVEPQPRVLAELDRYLERVWREARDPATGQFTSGGIGRSAEVGPTLDHAAIVALFAGQAAPADPD